MERQTKTIQTPEMKIEVKIYTYITGREYEYTQEPLFQAMAVTPSMSGDVKMGEINIAKVQESTHRMLEKMVVSVGEKKEDLLNVLLDMPQPDYQFVLDQINELIKKKEE